MDNTKNLKIKISTDISGGPEQFKALSEIVKQTDGHLKSLQTTIKQLEDGTETYTHAITIEGETLNKLRQAHEEVYKALNKHGQALNIAEGYTNNSKILQQQVKEDYDLVEKGVKRIQLYKEAAQHEWLNSIDNARNEELEKEKEKENKRKLLAEKFEKETLERTKNRFKEESIIVEYGKDSIIYKEFEAAKKIKAINEKLKNDLLEIQAQIQAGTINYGAGNAKASSLISGAAKQTIEARQPVLNTIAEQEAAKNEAIFNSIQEKLLKEKEDYNNKQIQQEQKLQQKLEEERRKGWEVSQKIDQQRHLQRQKDIEAAFAEQDRIEKENYDLVERRLKERNKQIALREKEREEYAQTLYERQLKAAQEQNKHLLETDLHAEQKRIAQKRADSIAAFSIDIEEQKKDEAFLNAARKRFAEHEKQVSKEYKQQIEDRLEIHKRWQKEQQKTGQLPTDEIDKAHKGFSDLLKRITEVYIIWGSLNKVATLFSTIIQNIPKTGIAFESAKSALTASYGSAEAATNQLDMLRVEAERTGIPIVALIENFKNFSASTSMAGLSVEETIKMFKEMNTVSTALHMSGDLTTHTFLALAQMFNKGKIQSEELVKQLGNLIPGAFAAFAKATNRTTQQLSEDMKKGRVYAELEMGKFTEFLATNYKEAFEQATKGLNASYGRFQTASTMFYEQIYKNIERPAKAILNSITDIVKAAEDASKDIYSFDKTLLTIASSGGIVLLTAAVVGLGKAFKNLVLLSKNPIVNLTIGAVAALTAYTTKVNAGAAATKIFDNSIRELGNYDTIERIKRIDDALKSVTDRLKEASSSSFLDRVGVFFGDFANWEQANKGKDYGDFLQYLKEQKQNLQNQRSTALQEVALGKGIPEIANVPEIETYENVLNKVADDVAKVNKNWKEFYTIQAHNKFDETIAGLDRVKEAQIKRNEFSVEEQKKYEKAKADIAIAFQNYISENVAQKQEEENAKKLTALKDYYQKEEEVLKTFRKTEEANIASEKEKYSSGNLSISSFYSNVKNIKDNSISKQRDSVMGLWEYANVQNDEQNATKYYEQLLQLDEEAKKVESELSKQKQEDLEKYNRTLQEVYSEYKKYTGEVKKSFEESYDQQHAEALKLIKAELQDTTEETRKQAEAALYLYNINKENYALEKESQRFDRQRAKITQDYSQQVDYLNTLKETGNISDFYYNVKLTDANEKQISLLEKTIELEKKKLAETEKNPNIKVSEAITDKISLLDNQLQRLKLTSNAIALDIQNSLTNSFTNSFHSFVTGATSAQEAAKGLFTDILNYILKIAEQEAASAIVKMLFAGVSATMGGGAGSFFSSSANIPYPSANGNVIQSGNILPFKKGGVIDSPIMFPLNKGTGIAGEAGPEAILPVKRTKSGELGVVSSGQGNITNVYNVEISVEKGSKNESGDQFGNRAAEAFIRRISNEEIQKANRPGGQNNTYRKFG